MGERIQLRGGWYEFLGDIDEIDDIDEPMQEEFFLPIYVVNQMAVFCYFNRTSISQ